MLTTKMFFGIFNFWEALNITDLWYENFEVSKYVLLCTSYYKIPPTFVLSQTLLFIKEVQLPAIVLSLKKI